ncbi:MAG: hypothetical protein GX442_23255 [Candidatus Riflebacteria bacterium]|nr:hypothetical protein [Candidatus Riflebacteria bacterium]
MVITDLYEELAEIAALMGRPAPAAGPTPVRGPAGGPPQPAEGETDDA